jgi:hypothetical protein
MSDVSRVMKDLTVSEEAPPQIVHLDHPHPIRWSEMIKHVADEINVPLVSYNAWIEALDRSITNEFLPPVLQRRRDHALRLHSVFHLLQDGLMNHTVGPEEEIFCLPLLDKTQMVKFSPNLNNLEPISKQDVLGWMKYWRSIGMM